MSRGHTPRRMSTGIGVIGGCIRGIGHHPHREDPVAFPVLHKLVVVLVEYSLDLMRHKCPWCGGHGSTRQWALLPRWTIYFLGIPLLFDGLPAARKAELVLIHRRALHKVGVFHALIAIRTQDYPLCHSCRCSRCCSSSGRRCCCVTSPSGIVGLLGVLMGSAMSVGVIGMTIVVVCVFRRICGGG